MIGCRPWEYDSPISSFPLKMIETAPWQKGNKAKVRLSYSCSDFRVSGLSLSFQVSGYTGFSLRIFMFYSPSVSSQISHGSYGVQRRSLALVGSPTGIFFSKVSVTLLAEMIGSKSISSLVHVSELRTFH